MRPSGRLAARITQPRLLSSLGRAMGVEILSQLLRHPRMQAVFEVGGIPLAGAYSWV